jgi:hypothetical protein
MLCPSRSNIASSISSAPLLPRTDGAPYGKSGSCDYPTRLNDEPPKGSMPACKICVNPTTTLLPFFRDRFVASRSRRSPRHPAPRRINLLSKLQRHPRRLPSPGLRDRGQVDVENSARSCAAPTRVECPLTSVTNLAGIPIHCATRLKIGAMLPGCSVSPISPLPINRRNISPSLIFACSSQIFSQFTVVDGPRDGHFPSFAVACRRGRSIVRHPGNFGRWCGDVSVPAPPGIESRPDWALGVSDHAGRLSPSPRSLTICGPI